MNPYCDNNFYYSPITNRPFCGCGCQRPNCGSCGQRLCDSCGFQDPCECPEPVLGIEQLPYDISTLRFNFNGKTVNYDFSNLIYQVQSDTALVADVVNRLLRYSAERHTDTITAQELGAIFHLADIGDVSTSGATNGSMLVYTKDNNCAEGCVGINNKWEIWNAQDNLQGTGYYAAAYDNQGQPVAISQPANPDQFYNLGWNGAGKLSYRQPQEAVVAPTENGYAYQLYLDPVTKETVYVKVEL